jgi:hypothetical protein
MDLSELLSALAEHGKDDDGQKAVVTGLQDALPSVHQAIFNAGYARGETKGRATVPQLEEKLASAQAKVTELEEALAESGDGNDAVNDLRDKVSHWKGEAERLKTALEEKGQEFDTFTRQEKRNAYLGNLRQKLRNRLHEQYAEVRGRDPELTERLTVADDGGLEVLASDGKTPLTVPAGKDPLDFLVDEVVKGTAAEFVKVNGDRGSGTSGGAAGGEKGMGAKLLEGAQERINSRPSPLLNKGAG